MSAENIIKEAGVKGLLRAIAGEPVATMKGMADVARKAHLKGSLGRIKEDIATRGVGSFAKQILREGQKAKRILQRGRTRYKRELLS